jgi:hypothetical protein
MTNGVTHFWQFWQSDLWGKTQSRARAGDRLGIAAVRRRRSARPQCANTGLSATEGPIETPNGSASPDGAALRETGLDPIAV